MKTHPLEEKRKIADKVKIKSFKARANEKRNLAEKFADWLTSGFGSLTFLFLNAIWFTVWILINTGKWTIIEPFDPSPFGLLTLIVSLEAIMLAIIVLISQNREARIGELREEIDLQINIIAEQEITKLIELIAVLLKKQGVKISDDPELVRYLGISNEQIERELEKQLEKSESNNILNIKNLLPSDKKDE